MVKLAVEMTIFLIKTISKKSEEESWQWHILFYSISSQSHNQGTEEVRFLISFLATYLLLIDVSILGNTCELHCLLDPQQFAPLVPMKRTRTCVYSAQSGPSGACCVVIGLSQSGCSFCFHSDWSRVVDQWHLRGSGSYLLPEKNDRYPWRWILLLLLFLILVEDVLLWDTAVLLEQWMAGLMEKRNMPRTVGQEQEHC